MTRFVYEFSHGGPVSAPFFADKYEGGIRFTAASPSTPEYLRECSAILVDQWNKAGVGWELSEAEAIEVITQPIH